MIYSLGLCVFCLESLKTTLCSAPLQGGGAREQAHWQPHGPQQPLHPGRSREQLLSLAHISEWESPIPPHASDLGELRLPRTAGSTGQKCKNQNKDKQQLSDLSVASTPATLLSPSSIDSQKNWSNLKLSLKCLYFWLFLSCGLSYDRVTQDIIAEVPLSNTSYLWLC